MSRSPRTRQEVEALFRPDAPVTFLYFWSHRPRRPGQLDGACLSQWYPAPFTVDGVRYATAEHWMVAERARLFGDEACLEALLATDDPAAAKALGRTVVGYDEKRWIAKSYEAAVQGCVHKFRADPALHRFLVSTAPRVLVEASPKDRVWGIGLGKAHRDSKDPRRWKGQNLLGFALMEARDALTADVPERVVVEASEE